MCKLCDDGGEHGHEPAESQSALTAGLGNLVTEGWMVYYNSPNKHAPSSDFDSSGFCTDHVLYKNKSEAVMVCQANGDNYEAKRVAVFEVPNVQIEGQAASGLSLLNAGLGTA